MTRGLVHRSTLDSNRREVMMRKSGVAAAGLGAVLCIATMAAPATAQTPKRGGILTFMIPADAPPSFDGHRETTFATVHSAAPFYSVLIRVNPSDPSSTTDFVCDLCTAMPTPTDSGKTYTFKIREGVKFHDGTPLTAYDVVANHPPARWHHQRPRELLHHGRYGGGTRPDHRGVSLEIRDKRLPAGACRSLHLDLPEGHPRQGSALVRKEHHGLRSIQVRGLRDRPIDQGRAQSRLLPPGAAVPRRLQRHLCAQAGGARGCHPGGPRGR